MKLSLCLCSHVRFPCHTLDLVKGDNIGMTYSLSSMCIHAGEQLWFLMKHMVQFVREKLSKKYAYTLINEYQKKNGFGDIKFFQIMRFYKMGIGLDKSLPLSQAKAEKIYDTMVRIFCKNLGMWH